MKTLEMMLRQVLGESVGLTVTVRGSPGSVRADPGHFDQVLMNLAVNARDAMPRGGKLHLSVESAILDETYCRSRLGVRPGPYVCVSVEDSGTGMDEATKERIFEPFFTTKGEGKGTGLGLSTVYGIVKQADGNIWVYSEPGRGTTFRIYFPKADSGSDGEEDGHASAGPVSAPRPLSVLVVDDDPATRGLMVAVLESEGHGVKAAGDAKEAWQLLRGDTLPDACILDVGLPGLRGNELATEIRREFPGARILLTSGHEHWGAEGEEANHPFIAKPFSPAAFLRALYGVVQGGAVNPACRPD